MQDNPFTLSRPGISQLLSSNSAALQAAGLDMVPRPGRYSYRLVWDQIALSASQGHGGFHFEQVRRLDFVDLIWPGYADILFDADPRCRL